MVSKVKPKKKFGFKNRKQKTKLPEVSELSISETDSAATKSVGYSTDDGVNVSDRRDERIVLSREQVQGRDVVVSDLTSCRLEIKASPLTLHLTNISRYLIYGSQHMIWIYYHNFLWMNGGFSDK